MACSCGGSSRCSSGKGPKGDKGEPGRVGATGPQGPAGGLYEADVYTAYAGGGQANATNLTVNDCLVETVATTGDSVKLLPALKNTFQKVRNYGANAMNVYPQSGESIDALAINVPYTIAAGSIVEFVCFADGVFRT